MGAAPAYSNDRPPNPDLTPVVAHVVYFIQNPLSRRDFDRFGIDYFIDQGTKVTVLDIADLMQPDRRFDRGHYDQHRGFDLRLISSNAKLRAEAGVLSSASFIVFFAQSFGPHRRNLPALRVIKKSGTPYVISALSAMPAPQGEVSHVSLARKLDWIWKRLRSASLVDSLIMRAPLWLLGIKPADYVMCEGRRSIRSNPLITEATAQIHVHAFDYDIFRKRRALSTSGGGTAVFLDQFIPYHHDIAADGNADRIDADAYHACLRRLFDRIEAETGLTVVIAAHPRSDYAGHKAVFGDRQVIKNKTAELIMACDLVIAHCSTALSFAVLAGKPIAFATSRPLHDVSREFRGQIDAMAQALGKTPIFMDRLADAMFADLLTVDTPRYEQYIADFIKIPGSPDLPMWEIVAGGVASATQAGPLRELISQHG